MAGDSPVGPKVLHVITGLDVGGAERMLVKLLLGTRGRFRHSVISLLSGGSLTSSLEDAGISVRELGFKPGRLSFRGLRELVQAMNEVEPEIVHAWMYHGNIAALAGRRLARVRPPLIWSIHGLLNESDTNRPLTRAMIWIGARNSSVPAKIVYKSLESQQQHEAVGYDPVKSVLMPNGFDTDAFRPDEAQRGAFRASIGVEPTQVLVGIVARIHPVKDHMNFVQACQVVASRAPSARFLIVGRGAETIGQSNAPLAALCRQLGDRLLMLPEQSDVATVMNGLDVHVVSSAAESFPNVLGEAMCCATASVSTDVGACREIVEDSGLIVPPKAPDALADAIQRLVDDAGLRRQMGAAGRRRVLSHYAMAAVHGRYENLWMNELARRKQHRTHR